MNVFFITADLWLAAILARRRCNEQSIFSIPAGFRQHNLISTTNSVRNQLILCYQIMLQ